MKRRTLGYRLYVLVGQWLFWFFVAMVLVTVVAAHQLRRSTVADRLLLAQSVAQHQDSTVATTFQGLRHLAAELPSLDSEAAGRLRSFRLHSAAREAVALLDPEGEIVAADPVGRMPLSLLPKWLGTREAVTPLLVSEGEPPSIAVIQPFSRHGRRYFLVGLMGSQGPGLAGVLQRLEASPGMVVSMVDASGAVLGGGDAGSSPPRLTGFQGLEEAISRHRPAVSTSADCPLCDPRKLGGGHLSVAAPLELAPWAVLVQQRRRDAFAALRTFQVGQTAAAVVLVLLGALVFRGISRSVVGPMESLARQARRLRQGDLATPVTLTGDEEIEVLAAALDQARLRLGATMEELQGINEDLEGLVAERTRALEAQFLELQHLHQVTREQDLRRRVLVGRLLSAAEEERRRLARELHDEIAQLLTAVQLSLAEGATGEGAQRARRLLEQTQEEVHRIIHDLRPSLLDDLGLAAAIREYSESHLGRAEVAVGLEIEEPGELPGEVEISVFRVFQEMVTNVLRHSRAETVSVELFSEGENLVLRVEDDGVGFDPGERAAGVGLVGMRERAALIGATLTVESEPGMGTLARLEVPLPVLAKGGAPK